MKLKNQNGTAYRNPFRIQTRCSGGGEPTNDENNAVALNDTLALEGLKTRLGSFAYSGTLPSATEGTTTVSNDVLELKVSNKGGYIVEARLKEHTQYLGSRCISFVMGITTLTFNLPQRIEC